MLSSSIHRETLLRPPLEREKSCLEFRCADKRSLLTLDMRRGELCQQALWRRDLYERILLSGELAAYWSSASWDVVLYEQQTAQRYLQIILPLSPFFEGKMRLWLLQCQRPTSLIQACWKLGITNTVWYMKILHVSQENQTVDLKIWAPPRLPLFLIDDETTMFTVLFYLVLSAKKSN